MPTITQLNQRNPAANPDRALDLAALYDGDEQFEARLSRFLLIRPREKPEIYTLRCREFEYRNYVGSIIDDFTAKLFTSKPVAQAFRPDGGKTKKAVSKTDSKPKEPSKAPGSDSGKKITDNEPVLDLDPYYSSFREDADLGGKDIDAFFKEKMTEAMVLGCSWIAIEQPGDDIEYPAQSKLEFETRKLGDCWLRDLKFNDVLDWETDEAGNLEWIIYHTVSSKRAGLSGSRDIVTETWEHYQSDKTDTYSITYDRKKPPAPEVTEVPLVASRVHSFGCAPVVCLQLPKAQHVCSRLKTAQLANFRLINEYNWSLSQTSFAMPVARVVDADAFSEMMVGAGYGVVIGVDEDWSWESPPNAAFVPLDTAIHSSKDEIYRIANQMALGVENNAAAVGRSAESKSQDAEATRVALTSYGRTAKQAVERVYDLISEARGDNLEWSISGLDDFAAVDTAGLLTLAKTLGEAGGIPSRTWNGHLKIKMSESVLPDLDEQTKAVVRQEVIDSIENEPTQEEKELAQFAAMHEIASGGIDEAQNGPGAAGAGGPKPPKAPTRGARSPYATRGKAK